MCLSRRFINTDNVDMMVYNNDNFNLYAYGHNNPMYYIDPDGTRPYFGVITLSCWRAESENILNDLEEYYDADVFTSFLTYGNDFNKWEKEWNNIDCYYDVIVLNSHANYYRLSDGSGSSADSSCLTISEINNLQYKSIGVLILLGCNAGHNDHIWTNVAEAFCKRISGCVVASDGTVDSGFLNSIGKASFTSVTSDSFYDQCTKKRGNLGWIIYKYKRDVNKIYVYYSDLYKIRIDTIMNYLKKKNYYK